MQHFNNRDDKVVTCRDSAGTSYITKPHNISCMASAFAFLKKIGVGVWRCSAESLLKASSASGQVVTESP